jgi:uncharacterized protein YndB with AHSA1/START domain
MTKPDSPTNSEVTIKRTFDAPRELLWAVWTDPKHVMQWWGPHDYGNPLVEFDLRPGGKLRMHMQAPDGTIFVTHGAFEDIVAPERLVFLMSVEFEAGVVGIEARTTVTFRENNGKTDLTMHQTYLNVAPFARDAVGGANAGWTQSFEKLDDYLRSM